MQPIKTIAVKGEFMNKKMLSIAAVIVFSIGAIQYARALSVPLAFGVTGDSEINPNTVVYRDASSLSTIALQSQTTTQLALRADPVGTLFLAQERVAGALVSNAYNLCASSLPVVGSYYYLAVATSAAAIPGAPCTK